MRIVLPHLRSLHTTRGLWVRSFVEALAQMPEASYGDVRQPNHIEGCRYAAVIKVDGKRVAIYTFEHDWFVEQAASELDLVLCCHYWPEKGWPENVQPFTMFAGDMTGFHERLPRYRQLVNSSRLERHKVGWSGRVWRCRIAYLERLMAERWFFYRDNYASQRRNRGREFTGPSFEAHVAELATWRWCLVLHGQGALPGASNRREHECAALAVPTILNYRPTHYEPMVAGEHYVHAPDARALIASIDSLTQAEASRVAANALDYWRRTMSPEGLQELFRRICRERL